MFVLYIRLQQTIQIMEQSQTNMVNADAVTSLEGTVEGLRNEVKRIEGTHRQLLLRYASIKAVIDDCFKKWDTQVHSSEAQMKVKDSVQDVIRDVGKSNRRKLKAKSHATIDPVDKVVNFDI
jgi:polyhydroxyalkanoate synthesis regulator phasin